MWTSITIIIILSAKKIQIGVFDFSCRKYFLVIFARLQQRFGISLLISVICFFLPPAWLVASGCWDAEQKYLFHRPKPNENTKLNNGFSRITLGSSQFRSEGDLTFPPTTSITEGTLSVVCGRVSSTVFYRHSYLTHHPSNVSKGDTPTLPVVSFDTEIM